MRKHLCIVVSLILLGQVIVSPFLTSEAAADTRITITFAAGGVACGVYYFFRFSYSSSLAMKPYQDDTAALFNHGPEGWHIELPSLNVTRDEHLKMLPPGDSPETAHIELLRVRF